LKILRDFNFSLIRESQVFIALCAALLCAQTYWITGQELAPAEPLIIFFATLFVYNLSRLRVTIVTGRYNEEWSFKWEGNRLNIIICILVFPVLWVAMTTVNHYQLAVFLITAFLTIAYMAPLNYNGKIFTGLRGYPVLKNILLGFIWSFVTVWFPLTITSESFLHPEALMMLGRNFLFIFSLSVLSDIRDLKTDRSAGIRTLAGAVGEKRAKVIAMVCMGLFLLITIFEFQTEHLPGFGTWLALMISGAVTLLVINKTRSVSSYNYFSFAVDGSIILQSALVYISSVLLSNFM
jgi:4-hydroxybenzoate polyprenyltransferase